MPEQRQSPCKTSCPEVFCEKGVHKNFAKFTEKYMCQSLFFNKVAGLIPTTLLKNGLRCFFVNFTKFLTTPFFFEHLRWLLLALILKPFILTLTTNSLY